MGANFDITQNLQTVDIKIYKAQLYWIKYTIDQSEKRRNMMQMKLMGPDACLNPYSTMHRDMKLSHSNDLTEFL